MWLLWLGRLLPESMPGTDPRNHWGIDSRNAVRGCKQQYGYLGNMEWLWAKQALIVKQV